MSSFQAHYGLDQLEHIFSNLGSMSKMSEIEAFFQELFLKGRVARRGLTTTPSSNLDAGIARTYAHFRCLKDPLSLHKLSRGFLHQKFATLVNSQTTLNPGEGTLTSASRDPKDKVEGLGSPDPRKKQNSNGIGNTQTKLQPQQDRSNVSQGSNLGTGGRHSPATGWLSVLASKPSQQQTTEAVSVELEGISEIIHTLATEVRFGKKKVT